MCMCTHARTYIHRHTRVCYRCLYARCVEACGHAYLWVALRTIPSVCQTLFLSCNVRRRIKLGKVSVVAAALTVTLYNKLYLTHGHCNKYKQVQTSAVTLVKVRQ